MELAASSLYWHGPQWLTEGESAWPNAESFPETDEQSEPAAAVLKINQQEGNYIFKTLTRDISSFFRMKRVLLCVCKFIQILQYKALSRKGTPCVMPNQPNKFSTKELLWAENQLIKWDQSNHFLEDIQDLMNNRNAPIKSTSLRKLHPFVDDEGILRVGGRLGHLDDDYSTKYPKILPNDTLAKLMIREMHIRMMHAGTQLLLAHCRRHYWPIGGRRTVKGVIHLCKVCFVHRTSRESQIMGDLPKHRISLIKAFNSVAIDCCGPFFIRTGAESRGRTQRVDVVIFVCTSTKAVHIEIVSRLTTEAFLASFARFTDRRGVPKDVYSDNGRNFLGAARELQRLLVQEAQELQDQTSEMRINWHFQPAQSPHFNGLAESAVKSAKTHLKRVIGEHRLNYEEFYTILTRVEAVLNSRPITILSDDPRDPQPLTPGHFLTFGPPTQLPDDDLSHENVNHLQRWDLCQKIHQEFARKWKISYLTTLQERAKWQTERENLKIDDIVILHDPSVSRNHKWSTGRVIGVHRGVDGKVRVIDIRTPTGTYSRSVVKVSKYPMCESHISPPEHVEN
ncbi:uncharacterized protein LOC129790975 [Lutzomyia longipalpis]|uniref:uncharacterized protein LOC129790975 n=1 Tax=Lutzomyia longipalpis TaxID=7200 RepID=UPI002483BA7B|nr:uncharacterized protein LOC129790975 [Lutzomyia longipalpis]